MKMYFTKGSAHLASTTFGWMYLQKPSDADIQEYTLSQGETLYNELFDCKKEGLLTTEVSYIIILKIVEKSTFVFLILRVPCYVH
jgi:hypothetical protein